MKNKKILLLGLVMTISGIILCIISYIKVADTYKLYLKNNEVKREIIDTENKNQNINIYIENLDIELIESDDEKIHISYPENEKEYIEKIDDEEIKFKGIKYNNFTSISFFNWSYKRKNEKVIFEIPDNYDGNIYIKSYYGDAKISDFNLKNIKIDTDYGDVYLEKLNITEDIDIKNKYADIKTKNINFKEMNIDSYYSDIDFKNIQIQDDITIKSDYGDIEIEDAEIGNNLYIDSIYSDISIKNILTGKDIIINSSNGDIDAGIVGEEEDYNIITDILYGDSNIRNKINNKDKTLDIKAEYSDVEVKFIK